MRRYYLTYRDESHGSFESFEQMMEWLRLLIRIDEQDGLPIDRFVRFRTEEDEQENVNATDDPQPND